MTTLKPNYTWCNHCNVRLRNCSLPLPLCVLQNERVEYVQVYNHTTVKRFGFLECHVVCVTRNPYELNQSVVEKILVFNIVHFL